MYREKIEAYFAGREDELIQMLTRLASVKSVREEAQEGMPFGKGPADALAVGLELAGEMGFTTRNVDNYVGVVDLNEHKTILGILCHLDVVGEGTGWNTPPYTPTVIGDEIFGRGVSDNKGPAVAALLALKAVKELGVPLKHNVRMIMGTDEESGSGDIAYYFAREAAPKYTFSPDGTFPVVNTEKGGLKPTFSRSWPVSEAKPRVVYAKGGYRLNVVPPEAEALVEGMGQAHVEKVCETVAQKTGATYEVSMEDGKVKIFVKGKGEHASTPHKGLNAITALIAALAELPLAESESKKAIHALNTLIPHGDFSGTALGIAQSDAISGSLTVAFTLFELSQTGFTGRFDGRTPVCTTEENSLDVVVKAFAPYGITVEGKLTPSHHTPGDSPFVKTLLKAYETYSGNKGFCEYTGGGTYVHNIEGGVCFGATMPGFETNMHGANEKASIKDLITAAKIFTQVIIDLCS
ncbi:MAG TPA: Sapep family Mn(2+)-dependent dipeptidase [Anaerolineaceae bacterium]|nr:Sapep family Mn(2+)-dependent dipeptidase [Anaerolineaceae bacterium]HPN53157.1 Sapep family Mn(2+)-dependent dipeptidase [Anaerolineaceae bacterium]